MSRDIRVVDDPAGAAVQLLRAAVEAGGHTALAGGSTPRAAYERVAAEPVDWREATLWFGDERCVPPDDSRSNHRMVREALLDRLPADGRPDVRRIRGEDDPEEAADAYEAELREALGDRPVLALVLLGLGPDAHTASLFPGKPAVQERERLVAAVPEAGMEPYVPRVTLTLPVLNAARRAAFLIAGQDKAEAVARAFGGEPDPAAPASLVDAAETLVLLDPAAARQLHGAPR